MTRCAVGVGVGLNYVQTSGGVFVPSSLSNLALDLRSDDIASLSTDKGAGLVPVTSNGDAVDRLVEKSSQARVFSAGGILRPQYRTAEMAGPRPALWGDGVDDRLMCTTNWALSGPQTWAFDFQQRVTSGIQCLFQACDGTTMFILFVMTSGSYQSVTFLCGYSNASGAVYVGFGGLDGAILNTNRNRVVICYNGTTAADAINPAKYPLVLWNGTPQTVVVSGAAGLTPTGVTIGARPDSAFPLVGTYRRALGYNANHAASAVTLDGFVNAA
jgi:hypothetical protein